MHRVLVADPPWKFRDQMTTKGGAAQSHYPCMTVEDIAHYPIPPMHDDSRLFMWRVASMQREALAVVAAWGFTPKTELVWLKTKQGKLRMGMGHYTRAAHETCIIASRGKVSHLRKCASVLSVFYAEVREHSRKPEEFYEIVESLYDGPWYELFARHRRAGWNQEGNQL